MENKQQTAVDFLSEWITKNIVVHVGDLNKAIEKAKEMEKDQIKNAWVNGVVAHDNTNAEEYYVETYKNKQS